MFLLRPPVRDLTFHLYDRPLHPELFHTLSFHQIQSQNWCLKVRITPNGHVLEYYHGRDVLVEVTAASEDDLPSDKKFSLSFQGEHQKRLKLSHLHYHVNVHAEVLAPEIFAHVHSELSADGQKKGLLYRFEANHRFGLTPLGLVLVDAIPSGIAVSTFHTYPFEQTIIKSQSLFEPQ